MDPQATWTEMLEALVARDWDTADERGRALLAWLNSGGFPPTAVGPPELGKQWHRDAAAHIALLAVARARNARRNEGRTGPRFSA